MAVPKRKMSRSATRSRKSANMRLRAGAHSLCPNCGASSCRTRCAATAAGTAAARFSTSSERHGVSADDGPDDRVTPVIALDAMGGDRAPEEIVAGGLRAAAELDVDVLLVGPPDAIARAPARRHARPPGRGARRDRSHRDGRRAGGRGPHQEGLVARARRRGGQRRAGRTRWSAPATPAPRWPPRCSASAASAACTGPRSRCRCRVSAPTAPSCSSTGAPPSTPSPSGSCSGRCSAASTRVSASASTSRRSRCSRTAKSRARATRCARPRSRCSPTSRASIGNVEGRDLVRPSADVIVTDGFTGNVALKTLEGAMFGLAGLVFAVLDEPDACADVGRRDQVAHARSGGRRCCPTTPVARCCSASTACA